MLRFLRGNSVIVAMSLGVRTVRGYLFMEFFHIILQDLTFLRCQFSTLMREAK